VTFAEDASHLRTGNAARAMATCRNLAIGALPLEPAPAALARAYENPGAKENSLEPGFLVAGAANEDQADAERSTRYRL
jgi:hypothetical protein